MTAARWLTSDPIAHRGLYDETKGAPQNSLAAFRRAIAHGMPFEFDVQYTADGCPMVWHDATVELPNGIHSRVGDLKSSDLTKLRLGDTQETVPMLAQVLELVDGKVPIVVDVRRWGFDRHGTFERAIASQLRTYSGPAAVQSFDPVAVWRFKRLTSGRPVGQASGELRSANAVVAAIGRAMPTNLITWPDFISYEITCLPSAWVDFWRRRGMPILAFPVDDEATEQRARQLADNFFFGKYIPEQYGAASNLDG
jgi:glycerophosphoryl diester phosphodiesterase